MARIRYLVNDVDRAITFYTQHLGFTQGDPSYTGPLAGIPLGLPTYHILEDHVRQAIPADVYQREVGPLEFVLDREGITRALRAVRERSNQI